MKSTFPFVILSLILATASVGSQVPQKEPVRTTVEERMEGPLEIASVLIEPVFSSLVHHYEKNPFATLRLKNTGRSEIRNVRVTMEIPGYVLRRSEAVVSSIRPGAGETIAFTASLDPKPLFSIRGATTGEATLELKYITNGTEEVQSLVRPVTLYGRHTINWNHAESIGSFLTDTDETVVAFARYAAGIVGSNEVFKFSKLPEPVIHALALWNAIRANGVTYATEPWKSVEGTLLDQLRYPREFLQEKSGDGDDAAVLLASGLEALGIRTKIVRTGEHVFLMFDTGLAPKRGSLLSLNEQEYVIHEGAVWIPLETTMIGGPFTEAWKRGAKEYHTNLRSGLLQVIDSRKAQEAFPSVVPTATVSPPMPSGERIVQLASADITDHEYHQSQLVGSMAARIRTTTDPVEKNRTAVIYARTGNYEAAMAAVSGLESAAAYNTMGNIALLRNDLPAAQEYYQKALTRTTDDGGIYLNFGLARYLAGSAEDAVESFEVAISKYESRNQALEVLGLERINEVLGTRASGKSEVQVSRSAIFALINRSLQNVPEKGRSTTQANRVREKYKDQQNKYVFGGRRDADPTQLASIAEFLYWKE